MTVAVDCPVCGGALPPVPVHADITGRDPSTVTVTLTPDLTPAWLARARLAHSRCFDGRDDMPVEVAA